MLPHSVKDFFHAIAFKKKEDKDDGGAECNYKKQGRQA